MFPHRGVPRVQTSRMQTPHQHHPTVALWTSREHVRAASSATCGFQAHGTGVLVGTLRPDDCLAGLQLCPRVGSVSEVPGDAIQCGRHVPAELCMNPEAKLTCAATCDRTSFRVSCNYDDNISFSVGLWPGLHAVALEALSRIPFQSAWIYVRCTSKIITHKQNHAHV